MDFIVLGIGLIFLICIIVGIYKGAIKIAVSLVTTLLTLVIVFFATPFVAELIESKTPVDSMIKDQVIQTMAGAATDQISGAAEDGIDAEDVKRALKAAGVSEEQLEEYGISVEDIVNGEITSEQLAEYGISRELLAGLGEKGEEAVKEAVENADIPKELQIKAIEMAELPEVFKTLLSSNNNNEIYDKLGVKTFADYVGEFLSKLIINIVAFICTFLLVTLVLRALVFSLDIVSELPVLGFFNRLAGGVIGAAGGLIIVWLLFVVITLLYVTSFGREVYQVIQDNDILRIIYENNPLMKLATNFM